MRKLPVMKGVRKTVGALAVTATLCVGPVWAQVSIPGTSVSMEPPAGFLPADTFAGFQNAEDSSSIVIAEFSPQAYLQLLDTFSSAEAASQAFAAQGISIARRTTVTTGDVQVPVLIGTQTAVGFEVGKYLALYSGENTVLVTFNVFDAGRVREPAILAALESVRVSAAPTLEEKLEQLSFDFRVEPPFRAFDVLFGGAVALTSFEGTDPSGLLPYIVIERMSGVVENDDVLQLSEFLLHGIQGFSAARITSREAVRFAGGSGYLIEAMGDEYAAIQYVHIPPDGRYLRLFARGAEDRLLEVKSVVAAIADSVVIKD
jgi:hypothetical protein